MVIDFRQNQRQGYGDLPGASDFAHVLGTAYLKPFIRILTLAKEALENFERARRNFKSRDEILKRARGKKKS